MAKKPVEKPPITGVDIVNINFLGLVIPNDYSNPVFVDDVDFIGFSIKTDLFSSKDYMLKVAMQVTCFVYLDKEEDGVKNETNKSEEEGKQEHDIEATAAAEFIFKVNCASKKKDFKLPALSDQQRQMAAAISYSTMRGMLHSRAAGTLLDGVILPILVPADILTPVEHK
jgi:hypothetical protein